MRAKTLWTSEEYAINIHEVYKFSFKNKKQNQQSTHNKDKITHNGKQNNARTCITDPTLNISRNTPKNNTNNYTKRPTIKTVNHIDMLGGDGG